MEKTSLALDFISESGNGNLLKPKDESLGLLRRLLESNRVSTDIFVDARTDRIGDLYIKIEVRRKRFSLQSLLFPKKKRELNGFVSRL